MIVEIILRQRSGDEVRIGSLPALRIGDRVRVDGRADWVIVRCMLPERVGAPRRVVCERRPLGGQRAA